MTQPRKDGWHPDRQGGGGKVCPQATAALRSQLREHRDAGAKCLRANLGPAAHLPGNPRQPLNTACLGVLIRKMEELIEPLSWGGQENSST